MQVRLTKQQLDKAHTDQKHVKFDEDFAVTLHFRGTRHSGRVKNVAEANEAVEEVLKKRPELHGNAVKF